MRKEILICIGITFLFLGVGIQPAIATVEPKTSDKDDCELCPSVNNLKIGRFKNVLDRLQTFNKGLLEVSKYNPNGEESRISALKQIYKEIKSNYFLGESSLICTILFIIIAPLFLLAMPLYTIMIILEENNREETLLYIFTYLLRIPVVIFLLPPLWLFLFNFECYDPHPY